MWDEIGKYLPMFESAVLNFADAEGHPYSIRCHPKQDRPAGILRLDSADSVDLRSGPSSLLCHSHDAYTWNQKIFLLRGRLEESVDGWAFRPEKFVPSIGTTSMVGMASFIFGVRRTVSAYLEKRGLPRPRVPWDEIEAVKQRAAR